MSYCGALPTVESDSRILIDSCLAKVREDAGLDNDPVLPPLHVLIGGKPPATEQIRFVVGRSVHNLPTAEAIVKSAAGAKPAVPANTNATAVMNANASVHANASERTRAVTRKTEKSASSQFLHYMRWPVFLCGFLAGTSGGIAVMKSPVGQKPAVQRVMKTVRTHAASAYAATARVVR